MTNPSTPGYSERLRERLPLVRDRIAQAAQAAGRESSSVCLVAVTKSHPIEAVEAALAAGLSNLGENRVEELQSKVAEVGRDRATWHMIGHVQSRKARNLVGVAHLVHSVDSLKVGRRLGAAATEQGESIRVLAQVNTSGEEAKSGFAGESALDEVAELAEVEGLTVDGLMTMAPFVDDERIVGDTFAGLRRLHERLTASGTVGRELSMGMTNDLEIAIREGSTMVRIGTALFGERPAAPARRSHE